MQTYLSVILTKDNRFLSGYAGTKMQQLCQTMRMKYVNKGCQLFKEGSIGDSYLVIFEGKLILGSSKSEKITELNQGDSLGEMAVLYGQPRPYTACVSEDSELIVLSRDSFEKVVKVILRQSTPHNSSELVSFLSSTNIFMSCSPELICYVTQNSSMRQYCANTVLMTQNAESPGIFIIYSGTIKIFKNIMFRESSTDEVDSMIKDPVDGDRKLMKQVEILELVNGESIGEYELFHNTSSDYYAVCSMPSIIFVISREELGQLNQEYLKFIQITMKDIPTDEQLRESYFHRKK